MTVTEHPELGGGGTIQIFLHVFKNFLQIIGSESRVTLPLSPALILPPDTRHLLRGPSLVGPSKYTAMEDTLACVFIFV